MAIVKEMNAWGQQIQDLWNQYMVCITRVPRAVKLFLGQSYDKDITGLFAHFIHRHEFPSVSPEAVLRRDAASAHATELNAARALSKTKKMQPPAIVGQLRLYPG